MLQEDQLLTREFAQTICDIFLEETNRPVIIVDRSGTIFAATQKERIGSLHPVAKQVIDGVIPEGVVTKEEEEQSGGKMKAGINIPIIFNHQRIAVLGIAGDPKEVRPLVGLASRTIQLWLQNKVQLDHLSQTVQEINGQLHAIVATVEQITAGAEQVASASQMTHEIAVQSGDKIKRIDDVLRLIKTLASQSNMIGLNAAIEAARVGEQGRGFAVVANEVRKLAATSQQSVDDVQTVLFDIERIFDQISDKVKENKEINQELLKALQSISESIVAIESAMSGLVERMRK